MSADNGVYILETKRTMVEDRQGCWSHGPEHKVYRIAHTQAIDNFDDYKNNREYNLGAYMVDVWGKSKVYTDKSKALEAAHEMADKIEVLEYGVSTIDASDIVFYGDI